MTDINLAIIMSKLQQSFSALRHRNFRLFLSIRFLLTFAAQMQVTVLGFYVYQLIHSKIAIAFIGLCEVIPAMGIALYGGHVADKKEKRALLLKAYAGVTLTSLLLFVVTFPRLLSATRIVYALYALLFCNGVARAFYEPALFTVYANSVPKDEFPLTPVWSNLSWQIASVTGPLVGGFLYAFGGGISTTSIVVTLLLAITVVQITRLSRFPGAALSPEQDVKTSLLSGFKFVFANKPMLYAMSLDLFSVFFGGVSALLPVYALDILHVGAEGLGIMRMMLSAGAVLTMLAAVRFPPTGRPWRNLLIAAGGFGICVIGFAFSKTLVVSLVLLFGQGAFDSIGVLVRTTLMPLLTPEHMRGRVSAVNGMFIASSAEIGDFESGIMASLLGTIPAVLAGGCITLGVVVFTFFRTRDMLPLSLSEMTQAPAFQPDLSTASV